MNNKNIRPIILIVGTRPEGIKMIPLYQKLKASGIPTLLCSTMQHDELLSQVFDLFNVKPDFNLQIMRQGQDLFYLTQSILQKTKELFLKINPSLVLVQGDTTSTMAASLAAFYLKIPVGHIEAGLRTDDTMQPFPEEVNRRMVSLIAQYHFAPTPQATANLLAQGINQNNIFCTGNTIVDAVKIIRNRIETGQITIRSDIKTVIENCKREKKKIMLLTTHRRESFDGGIGRILQATKQFLEENRNVFCFYPFHPNPQVIQEIETAGLTDIKNMYLCEPLQYKDMVYLITNSNIVLTDSGGIQEEAVSLSKPVLVLREKTERQEGIWSGLAKIVGTNSHKIKEGIKTYIDFKKTDQTNIYGDGRAAERIVEILKDRLKKLPDALTDKAKKRKKITFAQTLITQKKEEMKKISVLGLGYIGLPTAIILAENGFDVTGFDIDEKKVKNIMAGDPTIEEPELFEKLQLVLKTGTFKAKISCTPADYFIIAVPTPFTKNKKADLSYVFKAAEFISKVIQKGNTVLLESTVSMGTTKKIAEFLEIKTGMVAGKDFFVAHCPERVLPGKIFKELEQNDRVIGGIDEQSSQVAATLYRHFVTGEIYTTNCKTAEIVKLIENSSRDTQIAFAHQVASMAQSEGLDPYEIIELANKHPRVNILNPTCGVGGHCIAIDPWFLLESFPDNASLIKTVRTINDNRPQEIIQKIKKTVETYSKNKKPTVLLLGLTYKPDVDDLRESPALFIAKKLSCGKNINLLVTEPHIKQQKLFDIFPKEATTISQGLQNADIVVYLVAHKRFKAIDKKITANKIILDFCGITYKPKISLDQNSTETKWATSSILDFFIANSGRKKDIRDKKP